MKKADDMPMVIGVLGGGQLGMMLLEAAHSMEVVIKVLDPDAT